MHLIELKKYFIDNKYTKYYFLIIEKAIKENRIKNSSIFENHHILPKSIFSEYKKEKWNLVLLTFREHYILHLLLTKMFENKNQKLKMQNAMIRFIKNTKCSKSFSLAKTKFIERNKNRIITENTKNILKIKFKGIGNPFYGKKHTDETKQKIKNANILNKKIRSIKLKGENNGMFGKCGNLHPLFGVPCSEERKYKISIANKGKLVGNKNPSKRIDVRFKLQESWKKRKSNKLYITPYGEYYFFNQAYYFFENKNNISKYYFLKYFNNIEGYYIKKLNN